MKIAIIGKGRVATHMSKALQEAQHEVIMCGGKERTQQVPEDTEVVIISIKDDAIFSVSQEFACSNALIVHTSGSVAMDAIPSKRRGVFYPMQTFSLERNINFREVPMFLEASSDEVMDTLMALAESISDKHYLLSSEQRKYLHLAAVLSCNFVNHLMSLSYDVLKEQNIPFETLFPLIDETISKIRSMAPADAQTGPAIRWDEKVMDKHVEMLTNPLHKEIYQLLSKSIHEKALSK